MPIEGDRFLYRAWQLEDKTVIRCVYDLLYDDIQWEAYESKCVDKKLGTYVISRGQAKYHLKQPHKPCGFYGENNGK